MQRQIILDTETTGLDPKSGHRVIEIGCIELVNRKFTGEQYHIYLNPDRDSDEAAARCNKMAPEHLEVSVSEPEVLLLQIRHAGSIFLGRHSAEALGDYCAGPNHVLPTSATARFSSPLGVYDFQKRSSVISCTSKGATSLGRVASTLARSESLEAHARSAEYRIEDKCY